MASSLLRPLSLVVVTTVALLCSADAFADVPPGPNVKSVTYSFSVKGIPAGSERVLFAYPCGHSNGAPIVEHQKLEEGASVTVGRRGGSCTIYSIDKSAYEAWLKEYKPKPGAMQDPALEKLAGEAVKCTGGPTPFFAVDKSDPRSAIQQTITVTTLNATTCALADEPVVPSSGGAPAAAGAPSASGAPAASPGSKSRGCAFAPSPLSENGASSRVLPAALAAVLGLALARRRRR